MTCIFKSHRATISTLFISVFLIFSCKKTEYQSFGNNDAKSPHRVPTIKVENYVNRLFIDLVGRSALETELKTETDILIENYLSEDSRLALIKKLQLDTLERIGDSSYFIAYHQRLYDIMKSRMCEGAPDEEFLKYVYQAEFALKEARLLGDSILVFEMLEIMKRNQQVVDGKFELRKGEITINELFARLMDNSVYDNINMNTFNFVNASFDDLFGRFPTKSEFDIAYDIIGRNEVGSLLGGFASNKQEYCRLLATSDEFYEGLIRWAYKTLLGRDATSQEVVNHFSKLISHKDFKILQQEILVTDEYADF
ncbi:MAG: hypothetical protein GC181_11935 [Bacteroidetes bacterium]|nr:hypothetical protein [Bacteroidota bacterium]